jgi:ribosomal protein S18 acetylase RimI-like enzyme
MLLVHVVDRERDESVDGPDGSYVSYLGVLESARGRGVATGVLRTIIADAAPRGRDRVGLEVDADPSTGADGLYTSGGWARSTSPSPGTAT